MTKRDQHYKKLYTARFYTYAATNNAIPQQDTYGELVQQFSLHCGALVVKEKPIKPREVEEGDRSINEQQWLLISRWTKTLESVTQGMYCWIPELRKAYAVAGDAIDPEGDRKWIRIYVIDNVTQDLTAKIPGAIVSV